MHLCDHLAGGFAALQLEASADSADWQFFLGGKNPEKQKSREAKIPGGKNPGRQLSWEAIFPGDKNPERQFFGGQYLGMFCYFDIDVGTI